MKFLIVALSALALASAQTTTIVNMPLAIKGNTDGSATVTIGASPAITLPAAVVTSAKNVIGLINGIVSGVKPETVLNTNVSVTVNSATGAIAVTAAGQTIALDKNTINTVVGLVKNVKSVITGGLPRLLKSFKVGKRSNERRH